MRPVEAGAGEEFDRAAIEARMQLPAEAPLRDQTGMDELHASALTPARHSAVSRAAQCQSEYDFEADGVSLVVALETVS
jgi:hypothetical protein